MMTRDWRLNEPLPKTTPLLVLALAAVGAVFWLFGRDGFLWVLVLPILASLFVLSAAFGHRLRAAGFSVAVGLVLALPLLLGGIPAIGPYLAVAVLVSVWTMTIVAPGESKPLVLVYLALLLIAAPGLYGLIVMSGSNTQGGECAWVDEAEANWSWNGSPCRMDWAEFAGMSLVLMILGLSPFAVVAVVAAIRQSLRLILPQRAASTDGIIPGPGGYFSKSPHRPAEGSRPPDPL
jgi:hypothetical protein